MDVYSTIRGCCKRSKDTQGPVSEHIGRTDPCIPAYYRANPRLDSLCSLASYLNISVDAVIKDRKENNGSSTMQQILEELDTCSEEEQEIVLQTLRGLLKGLHTRTENPT